MKTVKTTEKTRDWRRGDEIGLVSYMANVNFTEMFQGKNACECWSDLVEEVNSALDRYIPLVDRRSPGQPPWFSKNIRRLVNRKKRHWKQFKSDHADHSFTIYKQSDRELKKAVQNAKRAFERKLAKSGNKRPFTSYVKSKSKSRTGVGPLKVDGQLLTDNASMANALNDFFVSVFTKDGSGPIPTLSQSSVLLDRVFITSDLVLKKNHERLMGNFSDDYVFAQNEWKIIQPFNL